MATSIDSFDDSLSHPHPFETNSTHADYETQHLDSFQSESNDFEKQLPIYGAGENLTMEDDLEEFDGADGPILPAPSEMGLEEGFALKEWRRENAIRLEEKENREKELLSQIIQEADEYKDEFYRKREVTCENNKVNNREKEKAFLANEEKFYAEADKDYWKAIVELIPREVAVLEKKRKKDQDKKPGISVIQGPKPGKPTDLSRMRQILTKLKHNTPLHLRHSPAPVAPPANDDKASNAEPAVTTTEPVAVA